MLDWHTAKYLWVYGTLRTGESNHEAYLAGRVRFVGSAICNGRLFTVRDCYPVMQPGGSTPVWGELFEPLAETRSLLFRELDVLEGVAAGYYRGICLEDRALYIAGEKMLEYCLPEYQIVDGDWCRYRRSLPGN